MLFSLVNGENARQKIFLSTKYLLLVVEVLNHVQRVVSDRQVTLERTVNQVKSVRRKTRTYYLVRAFLLF